MTQSAFNKKAFDIVQIVTRVDENTKSFLGSDFILFGETSVPLNGATINEAAFIRMTSYLYVLYYELGKTSLEFLIKEYISQHIKPNIYENDPRKIVHSFRTFFHHNLDKKNNEDLRKIESCKLWFQKIIGKDYPSNNSDWAKPLEEICNQTCIFLLDIENAIISIAGLETKDLFASIWKEKAFNSFTVYNFEQICISIIPYFGLEILNTNDFCKRKIQLWTKELGYLKLDFDFELEASKLIERDLIKYTQEESQKIPITGKEIMEYLNFKKPDKTIGFLLTECKKQYELNPCTKEALLQYAKIVYEKIT